MKNSSYYIAPVGDWTHDLPHTVASNMVKVSHTLNHSATEAVVSVSRSGNQRYVGIVKTKNLNSSNSSIPSNDQGSIWKKIGVCPSGTL